MVRITVNLETCQQYALCCRMAEDVFQINDTDTLDYLGEVDESRRAELERVAEDCPTLSIRIS